MNKLKSVILILFVGLWATGLYADGITIQSRGAKKGVNDDITSMTGLDNDGIPLAKVANAASDGANSDIISISGLTTPLTQVQGGTGGTSIVQQSLITNTDWIANSNSTLENVGSDLVTNGGFDSDTTGWTGSDASLASIAGGQSGNCLEVTRTGGATQTVYASPGFSTVVGKLYKFSFYVKSGTSGDEAFRFHAGSDKGLVEGTSSGSWVLYSGTFEAIATTSILYITKNTATAGTMLFDSVTLYEVTPGYVAADTKAPDGLLKTSTLDVHRQHNDATYTTDGSFYSLKVTKGAATAEYLYWQFNSVGDFERFLNRIMAFGSSVYSVTATDNVKVGIYHNGAWSVYDSFATADAWQWQELSQTINSSSTDIRFGWLFDGDSADVAYVQLPKAIFGSHIGEGNYSRPPGEEINVEATIALTDYTASAVAADATINLEAQSSGKIGKGIKAVSGWIEGQNSAADKFVDLLSASGGVKSSRMYSQVNAKDVAQPFRAITDANGDIYIDVEDGNWTNVTIEINAIELR